MLKHNSTRKRILLKPVVALDNENIIKKWFLKAQNNFLRRFDIPVTTQLLYVSFQPFAAEFEIFPLYQFFFFFLLLIYFTLAIKIEDSSVYLYITIAEHKMTNKSSQPLKKKIWFISEIYKIKKCKHVY